jgi:hypothetical protein
MGSWTAIVPVPTDAENLTRAEPGAVAGVAAAEDHGAMSSESRRNPLWYVLGVIVVGFVAWWAIKLLLSLVFYVIVGVIVVGVVLYLTRGPRRALSNRGRRKIDS